MVNTWKEKRNLLVELIKKVSDLYGGDEHAWLTRYTHEVIKQNKHDLDVPIQACQSILNMDVERITAYAREIVKKTSNIGDTH